MPPTSYHPGLHRVALLTAVATFPLIFMGGLVTSHGAGMSVPDWPNSYGYNMFLFPPSQWVGGILYEHTHRLMGSVVGLLSIVLAAWAWAVEERAWVRRLAYGVLGAVIFQGVLGGLRVVLIQLNLAIVHACFAQAFFCLAALVAVVTGRGWMNTPDLSASPDSAAGRSLARMAAAAVAVIYLQLVVGAVMRHYDAGLAIPDFPLNYGHVLPPTGQSDLNHANAVRLAMALRGDTALRPVTLGQIWLQFAHRLGAVAVTVSILVLAAKVFRRRQPRLTHAAALLLVLLATQVTLGVLTVFLRKPADLASAHVAVGALILMKTFVLAVRARRLYHPRPAAEPAARAFEVIQATETRSDRTPTWREREPGGSAAGLRA